MRKVLVIASFVLIFLLYVFSSVIPGPGERAIVGQLTGGAISEFSGDAVLVNMENSFFEFEGYAPGKSHVGGFTDWEGILYVDRGDIIGAEGIINASSVNAGGNRLNKHLRSDDFFETDTYPEISFYSTDISGGIMTGVLNFKGIERVVSFPVEIGEDSLSTEFFLDASPFGFTPGFANDEVRIAFSWN